MAGYKMVGNAVPCNLAYCLAKEIKKQVKSNEKTTFPTIVIKEANKELHETTL